MKKGFTLIELLSVIIILGIILVIAVPQILNVIETSKKSSLESRLKFVAKSIEQEISIRDMNNIEYNINGNCNEIIEIEDTCSYEIINNEVKIILIGENKFSGILAVGTKDNVIVETGIALNIEEKEGEYLEFENIFNNEIEILIEGNSIQDGVPLPESPIDIESVENSNLTIRGKNLFDINQDFYTSYGEKEVDEEKMIITGSWYTQFKIPVERNILYRLSGQVEYTVNGGVSVWGLSGGNDPIKGGLLPNNGTFNTGDRDFVYLGFYSGTSSPGQSIFENVQLEKGSVTTEYEPYVEPITIEIPTLRKVDNIADTYNPITGEYIQRIGIKTFNGNENIGYIAPTFYFTFSNIIVRGEMISSHYKSSVNYIEEDNVINSKRGSGISVWFKDNTFNENISSFKTWLTDQYNLETPVIVYYQLLEPIITYLEPINLNLTGTTIIEQDGVIKGNIKAIAKTIEK